VVHTANGATTFASVSAMKQALKLPTAKPHSLSTRLCLSVVVFVLSQMQPQQIAYQISNLTKILARAHVNQAR
jgi:hypothetical protein